MKAASPMNSARGCHLSAVSFQPEKSSWFAVGALFLALAAGCGGSPYELADTKGTVTIDGRPFTQGKVMFAPIASGGSQESGKPAFGQLQPDGGFVLQTGDSNGAIVGEHWATVIANNDPSAPPPANTPKFSRVTVPEKFKVEAARENRFEIKLSRQDVAKYGQK